MHDIKSQIQDIVYTRKNVAIVMLRAEARQGGDLGPLLFKT